MRGCGILGWGATLYRRVRQGLYNQVHLFDQRPENTERCMYLEEEHSGQGPGLGGEDRVQRPQEGLGLVGVCEDRCRVWKGVGGVWVKMVVPAWTS